MGTPVFAVPILKGLISRYCVIGVVTQPDRKVGRKQQITFSPIKELAVLENIPVFQPEMIKKDYQEILALQPDIIITCAYGQILPKEILDFPPLGCINVHASLLPKLRGGAPIHRAIMEGYQETGVTIMYMDSKMDSGDIISQAKTPIFEDDDLETLHQRLSLMGRDLLLETLPSIITSTNARIPQDENEVTYAYNVQREEEHLDFTRTSKELLNQIRGLSPNIGAYCLLDQQVMKVYKAVLADCDSSSSVFGEIICVSKKGITVRCRDGAITFTYIQPFGKKKMDAFSYLNGISKGDLIGKVLE